MSSDIPRLLFISNTPFSKTINNGKTFESFLSGWPKEKISQLYFNQDQLPDFDFCENYYRLTDKQILKSLINLNSSFSYNSINELSYLDREKNLPTENKKKYKNLLARDIVWNLGYWKTKQLESWLINFNPQIIFLVGGPSKFPYDITNYVKKLFNIPVLLYFTDDYYINYTGKTIFELFQFLFLTKPSIKKMIRNSKVRFVIGELMARDYEKIFKCRFHPLMNSIKLKNNFPFKKIENTVLKIIYVGGLHLQRWESLILLSKMLMETSAPLLVKYKFQVYTNDILSKKIITEFEKHFIEFKGSLNSEQVKQKLNEADILLHVESFDILFRKVTKYSISTKLPEYFAAGKCVLAIGPNEIASIRLISENNLGIALTDLNNEAEKREKVSNILKDYNSRIHFGQRAFNYALQNFDNSKIASQISELISFHGKKV